MDTLNLKLPDYYINRELSQLAFNVRVLQQAKDRSVPLLERLKFLCISSTNLDEFFEIRVCRSQASLGRQLRAGRSGQPHGGRAAENRRRSKRRDSSRSSTEC